MNNAIRIGMVWAGLVLEGMTCVAQERLLAGRVLESGTDLPLAGVHVVPSRGNGTVSDREGRFKLVWDPRVSITVRFTHIGFASATIDLGKSGRPSRDTLVVHLDRKSVAIPEVVVRRPGPQVVHQSEELHVGDFQVNEAGVWVLMYRTLRLWHRAERAGERIQHDAWLELLDTTFAMQARCALPGPVRALHGDHAGRPVVEGEELVWRVEWDATDIALHPIDRTTLQRGILPWSDSLAGKLLGSNRTDLWPVVDHVSFDVASGEQRVFCSVEDHFVMELFRSQYKYMSGRDKVIAMDLEIRTGIDREIIAGYMTGFPSDPYFRVPYAPLFVVRDTICIVDHIAGRIRRFTAELEALPDVSIGHSRALRWSSLLQDPIDQRIYATYTRASRTWLRQLDAGTGSLGPELPLTHPYPEQLQVHNGHVYYLYREHGSTQRRALYREILPVDDGRWEWISPAPDAALARRSTPVFPSHAMRPAMYRSEDRYGPTRR